MGRCKNCKYWGAAFDGECDFVDTISAEKAAKAGQKFSVEAAALDDSDLRCWVETGPEFGCIHFTEK